MPYLDRSDEGRGLNIFFSYASEDEKIADALARKFRVAFVEGIQITMMSEFPNGLNWRHLIEEHVAQTDILIALAPAGSSRAIPSPVSKSEVFRFLCGPLLT